MCGCEGIGKKRRTQNIRVKGRRKRWVYGSRGGKGDGIVTKRCEDSSVYLFFRSGEVEVIVVEERTHCASGCATDVWK